MTRGEILKLSDYKLDRAVRIAGTKFDRRRKLTDSEIKKIKKLVESGQSISYVATLFSVDPSTVKYHAYEDFKAYKNMMRNKYARTVENVDHKLERALYKRHLLQERKAVAFN